MASIIVDNLEPKITPELVVEGLHQLPSAARVLPRLKHLLCDTNSSMYEIVDLIRFDPGIAARVLKLGNSAYYNRGGARCVRVEEAVYMVGYERIYELVAYAVVAEMLLKNLTLYKIEADEMWKRAVSCAFAAEALATLCDLETDTAYTLGLLHGIGMVALNNWARNHYPDNVLVSKGLPTEYIASENALFGFHQGEVGAALLRYWDFDESLWQPVRWQYAPRNSRDYAPMATLLHIAKWLRCKACDEYNTPPPQPDSALFQALRLNPRKLNSVIVSSRTRFDSISKLLRAA